MTDEVVIDELMIKLARDYVLRVNEANGETRPVGPFKAAQIGRAAEKNWLTKDVKPLAKKRKEVDGLVREVVSGARTGVDGMNDGMTRFDCSFRLQKYSVWIEVQTSEQANSPRKAVQLQGQVIGLASGLSNEAGQELFYKIVASSRQILKWTREDAQRGVDSGSYESQTPLSF